ncbi:MAG: PSD1 and planctomycete cytochrome C domain-containing protein, partial [Planctomycetes bacterium]|nr:PSD1 and planctomycete cytochrome C domain-containing protein [Planctomycetota bacterium]
MNNGIGDDHAALRSCTGHSFVASLAACGLWFATAQLAAAEPPELPRPSERVVEFERDVAPLLSRRCLGCHGPRKQESGFRVDVRRSLVQGGDSGEPAAAPGKSETSPLIALVARVDPDRFMPPEGEPLTAEEVGILRAWIDQGMKWGSGDAADASLDHWSFEPPERETPPAVGSGRSRNAIDAFIGERLAAAGLDFSPEAEKRQLIRRVYLDLTGLLPAPEDVQAFLDDERPDAWERLVDRLLASPHYGERWGRHWLDVVGFAESHGFETNHERPNAWPYRDYVIAAFNRDLPYDRFIVDQIAGDETGADAATGFLVGRAHDRVKSPDPVLTAMQRQDELADMINTTGTAFLGLTLGCARCHSHKFDPVTQRDYYALQAVFAGVQHAERLVRDPANGPQREPLNPRTNEEHFAPVTARFVRFTVLATNSGSEPCLDELEVWTAARDGASTNVALASAGAKPASTGDYQGNPKHRLEHVHDGKYGNDRSWISSETGGGAVMIELAAPATVDRIMWGRDRLGQYEDRLAIEYRIEVAAEPDAWQLVASSEGRAAGLSIYAGRFVQPGPTHRLHRGDPMSPKEEVPPGAVAALAAFELSANAPEHERRLALARWIASPENPLTARVIVNRLWHYHFGRGLVATPSDF